MHFSEVNPHLESVRDIVDLPTETLRFTSRSSFSSRGRDRGSFDERFDLLAQLGIVSSSIDVDKTHSQSQSIPFRLFKGGGCLAGCLTTDPVFRIFLMARRTVDGCTSISLTWVPVTQCIITICSLRAQRCADATWPHGRGSQRRRYRGYTTTRFLKIAAVEHAGDPSPTC